MLRSRRNGSEAAARTLAPWRRYLGALLALALLLVSVGHICQHHAPQAGAPAMHAAQVTADEAGDIGTAAAIAGEHCHLCIGTVLPADPAIVARSIERTIPAERASSLSTHITPRDTPPPRTVA